MDGGPGVHPAGCPSDVCRTGEEGLLEQQEHKERRLILSTGESQATQGEKTHSHFKYLKLHLLLVSISVNHIPFMSRLNLNPSISRKIWTNYALLSKLINTYEIK